jgi:hypothetical protein
MARRRDHSRPLETRPGGRSAALSVCRNLVRPASSKYGRVRSDGACHGVAELIVQDDSQRYAAGPWDAVHSF